MKIYELDIACCFECPAYEYNSIEDIHCCNNLEEKIYPNHQTINPDCPLPDKND